MQTADGSMWVLPELMVIAGPNGSGKTTITNLTQKRGQYINADDIKRATSCSDMDAALRAEDLRERCLRNHSDFTFETVLSTPRNLNLMQRAKNEGYFVRCIYVLTANENINITRVQARKLSGGHDVPIEKIVARYHRALALVPSVIATSDIMHIYDNSGESPYRIFKKRKDEYYSSANEYWSLQQISELTGIETTKPFPMRTT